jgi:hypothetical protein
LKYYGRHIQFSYAGQTPLTRITYMFGNANGPDNPSGQVAHSAGNASLEGFPQPRYGFEGDQFNTLPGRYSVALPAPGDVVGGKRRRKTRRHRRK